MKKCPECGKLRKRLMKGILKQDAFLIGKECGANKERERIQDNIRRSFQDGYLEGNSFQQVRIMRQTYPEEKRVDELSKNSERGE